MCSSLALCRPHYVRCIKPNSTKTPLKIDETMLTHQVRELIFFFFFFLLQLYTKYARMYDAIVVCAIAIVYIYI